MNATQDAQRASKALAKLQLARWLLNRSTEDEMDLTLFEAFLQASGGISGLIGTLRGTIRRAGFLQPGPRFGYLGCALDTTDLLGGVECLPELLRELRERLPEPLVQRLREALTPPAVSLVSPTGVNRKSGTTSKRKK